jgi:sterol desaturase/sphingolipid hydroxylase (fatty acid hydroxylase superfamily)
MERAYVSTRDESVRMFRSDFWDRFTRVHPVLPHLLYVPIVAACVEWSRRAGTAPARMALLAAGGLAAWSLTEYLMHRWVFHFRPRARWQQRIYFMIHGVHHDYPNDSRRLVMPPLVSLPLAALFAGLFWAIFPPGQAPVFFAAFVTGYLVYDTAHYAIHHFAPRGALLRFLKRHHLRHHYVLSDRNFGVSSPVWDYVFGTVGARPSPGQPMLDPPSPDR